MSDHTEERIQLAEMMGWTNIHMKYVKLAGRPYPFGRIPRDVDDSYFSEHIPDPFTDANDCEALINHLQAKFLIAVTVTFGKVVRVDHYSGTKREIEIGDWKQDVCELALRVNEQWIKTFLKRP